jgi:hypothetical protein
MQHDQFVLLASELVSLLDVVLPGDLGAGALGDE